MKFKAGELHGKTVEEIEQILTEKLTEQEKWQIEECLNGRR
jgi:hypothetical protein